MSIENWAKLDAKQYYSYENLIEGWGYEVLLSERFGDYSGDAMTLLKDGEQFGLLEFGYGSCSGCDTLEASQGSLEELEYLRSSLHSSIQWRDNNIAMFDYLAAMDLEGKFWGAGGDLEDFLLDAMLLMSSPENLVISKLSSASRLLLSNPEVDAAILADSLEEDGFFLTPSMLRNAGGENNLKRLRKWWLLVG